MTQSSALETRKKSEHPFPLGALAVIFVLVIVALAALFFAGSSDIAQDGKISDKEAAIILTDIQTLIQIPQEKPVMTLIINADTLIREQAFYQGVSNGDILVLFPQARKAILYSPRDKRLINVGPINLGNVNPNAGPVDQTTFTPVDEGVGFLE